MIVIAKGKTYRSRSGRIWAIVSQYKAGHFVGINHQDNVEAFFNNDGTRWFRPDRAEDLVEEIIK